NELRVLVNDMDAANHLRDDRVNETVSRVSRLARVRQIVSQKLHDCAAAREVVIEGRDIGSVVFPDSPYKFYIDASPEVRLKRRAAKGERYEMGMMDLEEETREVDEYVIVED